MAIQAPSLAERVRAALRAADFDSHQFGGLPRTVFNDKRIDFRRLKLWTAKDVFAASQEQQQKLYDQLVNTFGDDLISTYFIPTKHGNVSLCIRLKPTA